MSRVVDDGFSVSGSSGPSLSSSWVNCIVFLGKALKSHSATLHVEFKINPCDGLAFEPRRGSENTSSYGSTFLLFP